MAFNDRLCLLQYLCNLQPGSGWSGDAVLQCVFTVCCTRKQLSPSSAKMCQ